MIAPYYADEHVQLFLGDARELMPQVVSGPCAVITDPPYGDTSLDWDRWPAGWVEAVTALDAAQLWSFGSFRMWMDRAHEFRDAGWTYAQEIVWEKHNGSGFAADRFKRVHELAVHWYRGSWSELAVEPQFVAEATARQVRRKARPAHTGGIGESRYRSEDGGPKMQRSVIFARSCHGYATNETQKPEAIVAPLVRYSTSGGGLVVDCFAGSGTTLAVAKSLGRRAIGFEMRESQCEAAAKRLSQGVLMLEGM